MLIEVATVRMALLRAGAAVHSAVLHVGVGTLPLAVVVVPAIPEWAGSSRTHVTVGEKDFALTGSPSESKGHWPVTDEAMLRVEPSTLMIFARRRAATAPSIAVPVARRFAVAVGVSWTRPHVNHSCTSVLRSIAYAGFAFIE